MTGAELQRLLDRAGLSQVGAARALEIGDRSMRRYVVSKQVPRAIEYAVRWIILDQKKRRVLAALKARASTHR